MKRHSVSDKMVSLSAIWESYAQLIRWRNDKHSEQKLRQRRFVLDKFLGHFINLALEDIGDICIGEMRNIGNELSQEFMRNVEGVTRNLSEEDAIRPLENYMLHGRGWKLLFTVDRVGLKGVSQRHDLCEVLINLLPFCLSMKPSAPAEETDLAFGNDNAPLDDRAERQREILNAMYNTNEPLSSCFQLVNKSGRLKQLGCPTLHTRKMRRVETSSTPLKKRERKKDRKSKNGRGKKKRTKNTPSKRILPSVKSETEEEGAISESVTLRGEERKSKQPRHKRGIRAHIWSPFIRDEDSETDDDYVGALQYIEDSTLSITAYHLIRIILKLLLSLGKLDLNQSVHGRTLSSNILTHLLSFISQFKEESSRSDEMSGVTKAEKWVGSHQQGSAGMMDQPKQGSPGEKAKGGEGQEMNRDEEEEKDSVPWQGLHRIVLLRQVVRAVLTLSGIVATQQNGVRILIHLKVVDTLLDIDILDSLLPSGARRDGNTLTSGSNPLTDRSCLEAGVAMDMICGLMQLLQTVYTNLPFNPSCINDANYLASQLTKPEIIARINHLIEFSELRAHQMEKTPSMTDLFSSFNSFRPSAEGGDEEESGETHLAQNLGKSVIETDKAKSGVGKEELNAQMNNDTRDFQSCHVDHSDQIKESVRSASKPLSETVIPDISFIEDKSFPTDPGGTFHSSGISPLPDPTADPVRCIGGLITTLKSTKVNYIHCMKCVRQRHRNCEYGKYYDHHHDILGVPHYTATKSAEAVNNDGEYEQSMSASQGVFPHGLLRKSTADSPAAPFRCVVSELATILLNQISEARFKASRIHLMSTLRSVGVCCCLQPETIISSIVPDLPIFSQAIRSYALDTMTSILLDHFQGAQENQEILRLGSSTHARSWNKIREHSVLSQDSSRCVHCYLEGSSPLLAGLPTAMDSGFSSCDIEEMRRQKLLERWKSLRLLRKIIISKDESLALTCAKHLMTLAIRGNSEIKEELFFGVYLHVLYMDVRMVGHCAETSRRSSVIVPPIFENTKTSAPQTENEVADSSFFPLDTKAVSDPSILNSQESLNDSFNINSSLISNELSSTDDAAVDNSVPSSIMLLCVSALPYVLQVDKVMSIFLTRGGLAKLTKLLDYEQLRAPVMSVFEALIMIDEQRLRGRVSDRKSVYEGGDVIQTFIDTLAKRTCTVTATLQQISLQNSKDSKTSQNKQSPPPKDSDFLKLYKSSCNHLPALNKSSKVDSAETQNSEPSVAEDTTKEQMCAGGGETETGLGSVSPYGSIGETLPVLLDMWKTCAKLCMNSRMFRAYYRESPCLYVVQETLVLALSLLGEISDPPRKCSLENAEIHSSASNSVNSSTLMPSSGLFCRSISRESRKLCHTYSVERTPSVDSLNEEEIDTTVPFHHEAKLEFIEAVMMVCFSCHTILPSQKKGYEDELWLRLNSALKSCIYLEPSKLSAVFQMLLNVALPCCPSILEYSYSQIVQMLNLREREDIADEDEVRQLLQQGLEEDGDTIFTEHGYEGDSECSVCFDWKRGLECSLQNQALHNFGANSRPCVPAAFRLFVELMVSCHKIAARGVILHTVALRLLQTLRSSKRAVRAFCAENLLEVLINGFRDVLIHCPANGKQSTLQEIILSLVQVIAQSEICASELRQLLRLFQDNTETSNSLLSTLLAVIEKSNVCPNTSITFPVKTLMVTGPPVSSSSELGMSPEDSLDPSEDETVWARTAVEIDVPVITWPPNPRGFSVAMWMCVDSCQGGRKGGSDGSGQERGGKGHSDSEDGDRYLPLGPRLPLSDCLLLFGIGNKEKMLEIWLHHKTASLYCRLTEGYEETFVLKEQVFERMFIPNKWHLLVVSYVEDLDGSTFVGKLNVVVDGWQKQSAVLDHPASLSRKNGQQRPFLCLGDARNVLTKPDTGTWRLGTLRLFRDVSDAGISDDWWFHLYCLGPNRTGISKCDCGELRACYTPAMLKHMATVPHLNWDVLVGVSPVPDMDRARTAQVLLYNVSHPEMFSAFATPHTPTVSRHDDLGLVPSAGAPSDLLTQKPVILATKLRGRLKVKHVNTLETAVEQAGGIEAFLFFVAKIYEDSMKAVKDGGSVEMAEHLQGKATHILFQLVHQFPTVAQAFVDTSGYAMLAKVLTSSISIVGYQLLKVLMDACTSESVFKFIPDCQHPVLRNHPEAVIRDVEILSQLLLQWRIWHKAGDEITTMLFGALEALVSPKHPYRNFNLKQMQAGGVMNKIFSIYLERIQDAQPSLSVTVSQSASKVIKSLLGSPPDLHLLMAVMDFLLLVHPAPNGFISFTPGSFYFKLWWDGVKPRSSSVGQKQVWKNAKPTGLDRMESAPNDHQDRDYDSKEEDEKDYDFEFKAGASMSSGSYSQPHDDDLEEEEEEDFKYPPLKPTNTGFEQSQDHDADYEESDVGWTHKDKNQKKSFHSKKGTSDAKLSPNTLKLAHTSDVTSSYGEEEEMETGTHGKMPVNKTNGVEKSKTDEITSVPEGSSDEVKEKRVLSLRRKLMYSSSDASDENKHGDSEAESGRKDEDVNKQDDSNREDDDSVEGDMVDGDSAVPDVMTSSLEEENDEGLMTLCVSLIDFMTQIISDLSESSLDIVFSKVVSPKSMLVLAKNPCSEMRLAVMKLLGAYLSKAPANLIDAFVKMDGFYLLANQLRSFPVNINHVETAVTILLRQEFHFDDNFMLGDLGELSSVQQAAPILLLSLLDGTAYDTNLCRNVLKLLPQLLDSTPTMSTLLLDLGLAETMCNLATHIQRRSLGESTSPEEDEQKKALLVEVQHVLCCTAVREFSWTGVIHFQNVEDMFTLLKAVEDYEYNRGSEASKKRADTARAFQISFVVKMFEYVEKRSEELMKSSQGWFTASGASLSSSTKSLANVGRHKSFNNYTTPSSTPSSPSGPSYLRPEAPVQPLHQKALTNAVMRRSPFSSPDIIGCLSEPMPDDHSSLSTHFDNDSSGSGRAMPFSRLDVGSEARPSLLGNLFGRKRKMIFAIVTQSDLLDRFRKVLLTATNLAVMFPRVEHMRPLEQRGLNLLVESKTPTLEDRYLKHLFCSVFRFYEHSLNKEATAKKNRNPIMHGARDVLKMQFTRLFLCMMSPKVDFEMRSFAVVFIMTQARGPDAVKSIITDKQVGSELSFYLHNLLATWKDWLNPAQRENGFELMRILRGSGVNVISPDQILNQAQVNTMTEEKKQIDARYRKELTIWLQRREAGTSRIIQKFEPVRLRVTEQAMKVTQDVTRLQIEERKKLVAHIKHAMTTQIQLKKQWQELVQTLSHERGVWHQKASYPQSWQLDPTEGPGRVRKRLQRCHLGIDKKFLLPEHQQKLEAEKVDPPLIFLFEDDHQMSDSAALIYKLYTNEKIQHTCKCTVVSPASESKGELLIGEVYIYFVADEAITVANYTQMLLGNLDQLSITWPHTDIRELHKRWYQLQDVGLEIFLISGRTCLLAFQSTQDRDELYSTLRLSLELPNVIAGETLQAVQHAWLEGEVTNYEYLMHLNKLAGRSYTDLMQYPVFPFILRDYQSDVLDLTNKASYRKLMKPIAVQDKSREKRYKDNYEFLCQEANRPHAEDEMVRSAPFHYGSHYSNSGTVLYYMVRLPPFTKMFVSYQDSNFDIPDRTFHSMGTSWRLSSFESSTDVKELIPEFFFLPEFLMNNEGFDFGHRQNGESVNHVILPPWCEGNARLFILIQRQALESAMVTANLHSWLDLVFGYKQQGHEAVRAINVFHPSTYFGVDASVIKDNVKRQALLTMIKTYGQTPKQLFRQHHPAGQPRIPAWYTLEEKHKSHIPGRALPTVIGLRWGNYLGSPDLAPPVYYEIGNLGPFAIAKLVALSTGQVFGVEKNANILQLQGKQRELAARSTDAIWAGVVTWGYFDNIIRIRSYNDKPLINFIPQYSCGEVSCIESVPDCRLLFIAGTSGNIRVYSMTHNSSKPSSLHVRGIKKTLYGHSEAVTTLCICPEFSILVSGSSDGTCIIWDLNRLTYVRSITSHCAAVSVLTVSSTLGDIASVSRQDQKSCSLQLHTINASHVATQVVSDIINCVAYSSAPEGRSINVIAGALQSGVIRLWSSWNLTPLRDLVKDTPPHHSIVSLTFSSDSQYLMAASVDGTVILWDKDVKSLRSHINKFVPVINSSDGDR